MEEDELGTLTFQASTLIFKFLFEEKEEKEQQLFPSDLRTLQYLDNVIK